MDSKLFVASIARLKSIFIRKALPITLTAVIMLCAQPARADCPTAPLASTSDMIISFAANKGGTQAAPSTQFASSVKEGMLLYDDTANALKLCDGTNWSTIQLTGGTSVAAGTVAGAVQFRNASGNLAADDANFIWDDTNNRLGIGTTTPTNILSLGGDAARTIWMERSATAAATGNSLTPQAGGTKSGNTDQNGGDLVLSSGTATGTGSSNITFKTAPAGTTGTTDRAPATAMTILGNGNVGIGTTDPTYKLHVSGRGVFTDYVAFYRGGSNSQLSIVDTDNARYWALGTGYGGGAFSIRDLTAVGAPYRFLIDTSGNVGIGTTGPSYLLDVNGNARIAGSAASFDTIFNFSTNKDVYIRAGTVAGKIVIGDQNTGTVELTGPGNKIISGNVGIGTTAPQSALHVPDGKYAQFEDFNAGAPPAADCDADTERGRQSIDTTNFRLYICMGVTRGWDYATLTD